MVPPANAPLADSKVVLLCYLAHLLCFRGYPDQARQYAREAGELAQQSSHAYTIAFMHDFRAAIYQWLDDPSLVLQETDTVAALHKAVQMEQWRIKGMILQGWAYARQSQRQEGIARLHEGIQQWRGMGAALGLPRWLALLADAYGRLDQPAAGLRVLDEACAVMDQTGDRHYEAEIYRLQGALLRQQHPALEQEHVERCLQKALQVAQGQQTKFFELRATIHLCNLWRAQGRSQDARQLLTAIYAWFSEGFDTADLQAAKALLRQLTEDVSISCRMATDA
jgi:predicted ATPase